MTSWYSTSWTRRLKVTIPYSQFAADESDKAVLIDESLITDGRFWWAVLSTGADIVVTKDDGVTKVRRQLIAIDTTAETIELYFHASVLSSTVDNVFYIYYGNAAGAEANDYADYESYCEQTTRDQIVVSGDDGMVYWSGAAWVINTTERNRAGYYSATVQKVGCGLVFTLSVTIPQYSHICPSKITFTASTNRNKNNVNTKLVGQLAAGSNFTNIADYQARRGADVGGADDTQRTVTEVAWDAIGAWVSGTAYDSPDIATVLQEIVDGRDVAKLTLFWDDHEGRSTAVDATCRDAWQWGAGTCPLLTVNYIPLRTTTVEFDSTQWGTLALTPARTVYKIEIHNNNGLLKHRIVDMEQATLDQSVNNPAAVSLTCPMSPSIEAALSSFQRPNQLWVIKDDDLVFTGNMSLIDIAHSSLESVRVDSLDWMNQLKDEFVEYYDASDTVDDHIEAYLNEQVDVRPVLLGTIEPTLTRDITIERDTIYNALMNLRDSTGGYMVVDPYHKLHWYWTLSEPTGQQIRYKKNLVGITKSTDWMNFGNKLYIYGDGCDLTDAGYATTYIEDTDSIDTYGLVIRKIYKQSFASAATMLEFAKLKIQEMAFPRVTYTVDIANLEDFGFTEDELTLGTWLTLIDEEIGVNVTVQIVRIIWDLVRCEKVQIELAVKSSDICDIVPGSYIL